MYLRYFRCRFRQQRRFESHLWRCFGQRQFFPGFLRQYYGNVPHRGRNSARKYRTDFNHFLHHRGRDRSNPELLSHRLPQLFGRSPRASLLDRPHHRSPKSHQRHPKTSKRTTNFKLNKVKKTAIDSSIAVKLYKNYFFNLLPTTSAKVSLKASKVMAPKSSPER